MAIRKTGKFIKQPGGYKAFIPYSLAPTPAIEYDDELRYLLSEADRAIAKLDGMSVTLPNPELFIAMYVKKEALLSAQIEGTQASLEGVLRFEANLPVSEDINQVKEVVNYIKALNLGLEKVQEKPITVDLIKWLHKILLEKVRGSERKPGEFRSVQNWVGPPGGTVFEAVFVPPPPEHVERLMLDLEKFINAEDQIPPLVKVALIHAQFETIHPFLDGNGRMGRLLITLYLTWRRILTRPLLYLSFYLKKYRNEYYTWLMKVRKEGDWEGWLKFFLNGVIEVSKEAAATARDIILLKDSLLKKLYARRVSSIYAVVLLDLLFKRPIVTSRDVIREIQVSKDTANQLIRRFVELGILKEISGKKRYKSYLFGDYVEIIKRGTEVEL